MTIEEDRFNILSKMNRPSLVSIAKNLKIKYLTQLKKKEIVVEIIGEEFSSWESDLLLNEARSKRVKKKWICIHNKQKYKCIPCDGSQICEHKKQKPSCKKCRQNLELLCKF